MSKSWVKKACNLQKQKAEEKEGNDGYLQILKTPWDWLASHNCKKHPAICKFLQLQKSWVEKARNLQKQKSRGKEREKLPAANLDNRPKKPSNLQVAKSTLQFANGCKMQGANCWGLLKGKSKRRGYSCSETPRVNIKIYSLSLNNPRGSCLTQGKLWAIALVKSRVL